MGFCSPIVIKRCQLPRSRMRWFWCVVFQCACDQKAWHNTAYLFFYKHIATGKLCKMFNSNNHKFKPRLSSHLVFHTHNQKKSFEMIIYHSKLLYSLERFNLSMLIANINVYFFCKKWVGQEGVHSKDQPKESYNSI